MDEDFASYLKSKVEESQFIGDVCRRIVLEAIDLGFSFSSLDGMMNANDVGKSIEAIQNFVTSWRLNNLKDSAVAQAIADGEKHSLTKSEIKGLAYIYQETNAQVERKSSPDFVVDDKLGFEVKASEDYSLRRSQIHAAQEYERFHVVVAKRDCVRIHDTIDYIGVNVYQEFERKHRHFE
jgi:hypothetical protein